MMVELTSECQQHQLLFTGVHGCLDKGTCKNLHPAFPLLSMEALFWRRQLPLCVLKHHLCVCYNTCTKFLWCCLLVKEEKKHKGLAPKMLDSLEKQYWDTGVLCRSIAKKCFNALPLPALPYLLSGSVHWNTDHLQWLPVHHVTAFS